MFNNKQNHFSNTALTSLLTTILLLSANAVMSAESTQRDILLALTGWALKVQSAAGLGCSVMVREMLLILI